MENGLIGCLGLVIGLGVSNSGESGLADQVAEIVGEPIGVELPTLIKDDGTGMLKRVMMFRQMNLRT